jgi:tetratricopeptide (TPR) repeat protein
MRAGVLRDPALAKHAGRFVWLSVDIDKDENASFLAKFPVVGVPTFLVIDGAREKVALTRSAAADLLQLVALFNEGERAVRGPTGVADAAFVDGERAFAEGHADAAVGSLRRALAAAPRDWPDRHRAVESLVLALDTSGDKAGCARAALDETRGWPHDGLWANVIGSGLGCALELPVDQTRRALEAQATSALGDALDADDRSSLYELMVAAHEDDVAEKRRIAGEWLSWLEGEAARAPTPQQRAAFDAHRLEAAIALGDPARAIPALQASERDLPDDYNAPARLAMAYLELGRLDEALAANDRARVHVYGPRRLRIEENRAAILRKQGDEAAARRTLEEAIRFGESLPKSTRTEAAIARLRKLLK